MPSRYLVQPFKRGAHGGAAMTDDADRHLRDKVLAILFTAPGERINQPRFGVGLNRAVFEPLDDLTVGAVEFRITEGLRRDLGDEAIIDGVNVSNDVVSGELLVNIAYRRRTDRAPRNLEIVL
jgi:hypothetical protein